MDIIPNDDTVMVAVPATGTWMVSDGVVREVVESHWDDYRADLDSYEIWVKRPGVTGGNSDG